MQTFQRTTARRIAGVTLVMAACASPLAPRLLPRHSRRRSCSPAGCDTFNQLAPDLHRQLQGVDEAATRTLMTNMVQLHFDVLVYAIGHRPATVAPFF